MQNDILKGLEKSMGMKNLTIIDKENGTFNFSCDTCGKCCKNRDDIILSPYDVFKLSKGLNLSSFDFINKYCEVSLGENSYMPLPTLKFKERENYYTFCPFLKNKDGVYKCNVHDFKPSVCALFPLGRAIQKRKSDIDIAHEVNYILQNNACGNITNDKYTIKEWLGKYNIEESEEAFIVYSNFTVTLLQIMNFEKFLKDKKISDLSKTKFYNGLFGEVFFDMNTNNNVLNEIKSKLQKRRRFHKYYCYFILYIFKNRYKRKIF